LWTPFLSQVSKCEQRFPIFLAHATPSIQTENKIYFNDRPRHDTKKPTHTYKASLISAPDSALAPTKAIRQQSKVANPSPALRQMCDHKRHDRSSAQVGQQDTLGFVHEAAAALQGVKHLLVRNAPVRHLRARHQIPQWAIKLQSLSLL